MPELSRRTFCISTQLYRNRQPPAGEIQNMTQFPVHTAESAPAAAKEILAAVQTKFGFVPNLIGVLAESPAALKGYLALADAFAASSLSPVEQQVVLLTTSLENRCTYCVAAHSMLYRHSGGDEASLRALREGEPLADPRLEALRRFTRRVVENRGWVDEETVQAFLNAGFTRAQVLEVILGITQKTLSNYTNHVAATPVDSAFANFAWQPRAAVPGAAR